MSDWYRAYGKRVFDAAAATVLLVLLSPLLLVVALTVRLFIGTPVLFRQHRPGRQALPFVLLKFRTMTNERGMNGDLLPDRDRLPGIGRTLRSLSLDELPELWNVVKGEMSLVGPRPLLMEYLPLYSAEQARRHEVRPGITGWAQVNGRNASTWQRRFAFDVWYVDHMSMWLDVRILVKTVTSVVLREGIAAEGHATMPKFTGREA